MLSAVLLIDKNKKLRVENQRQKRKRVKRHTYIARGGILLGVEGALYIRAAQEGVERGKQRQWPSDRTGGAQVRYMQINRKYSTYVPQMAGKWLVYSYTKYNYSWLSNSNYLPLEAQQGGHMLILATCLQITLVASIENCNILLLI